MERIDTYWNKFFNIQSEDEGRTEVIVVPHNYLGGYKGSWIFRRKNQLIISVEPDMVQLITEKIQLVKPIMESAFSEDFINYLFKEKIERVIGPVYQGYFDGKNENVQLPEAAIKIIYEENSELIKTLSNSGDSEGWSNSGIGKKNDGLYGYFYNGKIESIGCYTLLKGDIAFIGVYTNPACRGKSFSQDVLRKMVADLSEKGKLIRYQTLVSNKPSISIATKIGFKEYAQNIAIRFKG